MKHGIGPTVIPSCVWIPVTHREITNQVLICSGYAHSNSTINLTEYHPQPTTIF